MPPNKKDPRKDSLGYCIYRAHSLNYNSIRRAFQNAGYDETGEQFGLLVAIYENEGASQSQLAEKTLKDRHNVTRILNLLEKRGSIERRPDRSDKRIYRIFLTKAGKDTYEALMPVIRGHAKMITKGLSTEDIAIAKRVLEQVGKNCSDLSG